MGVQAEGEWPRQGSGNDLSPNSGGKLLKGSIKFKFKGWVGW